MIDKILNIIEKYSSKLNVWSWQLRWGNREKGYGYKNNRNKKKYK